MTALLLWLKRAWAFIHSNALKIGLGLAALGVVIAAIVKAFFDRQESESSQAVRDAETKHETERTQDAIAVAGAVGESKGEEKVAEREVQAVVESTPPQSEARVDGLADELAEMSARRHQEALEAARRKR